MKTDYHIHTRYSADSAAPIAAQLDAAAKAGITHLCFTDHVDFDGCPLRPADIAGRNSEIASLAPLYPQIEITCGAEIGLKDAVSWEAAMKHLAGCRLDFIIGSVHMVDGQEVHIPYYLNGKSRDQVIGAYLDRLSACVGQPGFSVMGHYDFCIKYASFPSRYVRLCDRPQVFDSIFRKLIQDGKAMEINTAAWMDDPAWGLDVLTRYRELGGEFVTMGSDAHVPSKVGCRLDEAVKLAKAAGIRYAATFKELKPVMHRL